MYQAKKIQINKTMRQGEETTNNIAEYQNKINTRSYFIQTNICWKR